MDESSEGTPEFSDFLRAIGRQIRLLRERAGLTQEQVAERLGHSVEHVGSIERGRRTPQVAYLVAIDELLGAEGLLLTTAEDIQRAKAKSRVRHPAWFRDFARLEADADESHDYSNQAIPGLLQSEDYARAIFRMRRPLWDEDTIEARTADRMARKAVFDRWPPLTADFVIEEWVLHRPIGGPDVLAAQLEGLLALGRRRTIEIQVMPMSRTEHPCMDGPVTLLTPRGGSQVAYTEIQGFSRLVTEPEEVRLIASKYGMLRAQALTPSESLTLIETLLGDG
jgi:transcriptional regulator with XRE-family HTH domain